MKAAAHRMSRLDLLRTVHQDRARGGVEHTVPVEQVLERIVVQAAREEGDLAQVEAVQELKDHVLELVWEIEERGAGGTREGVGVIRVGPVGGGGGVGDVMLFGLPRSEKERKKKTRLTLSSDPCRSAVGLPLRTREEERAFILAFPVTALSLICRVVEYEFQGPG